MLFHTNSEKMQKRSMDNHNVYLNDKKMRVVKDLQTQVMVAENIYRVNAHT